MERFYETCFDTLTGAAVEGAQVFLLDTGGNVATIYEDLAGTIEAANPMISDSNGFVQCYAADGLYNIEFRANGVSLRTIENIPIFDLADMRADIDALATSDALKAATTYVDAADTALANSIAALDAATYSKAEVDALIPAPTDLSNYYTKGQVDALIPVVPSQQYHYGSFAVASILASEILMDHQVASSHTISANFAGCVFAVGTPPAADFVLDVQYDGVSIGTVTIHHDGTWTGATSGGTAKNIVANHYVTAVAPIGADASIARLRFTFRGTI